MVALVPMIWNLSTSVLLIVGVVYANKLRVGFRGSKISSVYTMSFWAFTILFLTFFGSFLFDLVDFSPVASYSVSVKDLGSLVAATLFMGSLRSAARFWLRRPESVAQRKPDDPILTR